MLATTERHFKHVNKKGSGKEVNEEDEGDVTAEVAHVIACADANSVATALQLQDELLANLRRMFPLVESAADIASLPRTLAPGKELGVCAVFHPALVDQCCQLGMFPLAIRLRGPHFLFAPQCQLDRALTRLVDTQFAPLPLFGPGIGLLRERETITVAPELARRCRVFVNRLEDVAPALDLIRRQHGDNWLCRPLRACFVHMLLRPAAFRTRIVVLAVRADDGSGSEGACGPLVAAELGFVVGDMYTSATGAYCVSGAGALQLAALGAALRAAGCPLWDLGMHMAYKARMLSVVNVPRSSWHLFVAERRALVAQQTALLAALQRLNGTTAAALLGIPPPAAAADAGPADPAAVPSKARLKREAKAAFLAARRRGEAPPPRAAKPAA